MISSLVIHPDISQREAEIEKILSEVKLSRNHSDVLWFSEEEKLGIEQARKIQAFLSLKPYQGKNQAVVLISAENLTLDAQNALLKTLEEAGKDVSIILGAASEDQLLPTIISRCKIINLQVHISQSEAEEQFTKDIEKLLESTMEERFKFIEKLEDKENFLYALITYFRSKLLKDTRGALSFHLRGGSVNFLKNLMEAEKWAKQNVNLRAILEYLMLKMPKNSEQS